MIKKSKNIYTDKYNMEIQVANKISFDCMPTLPLEYEDNSAGEVIVGMFLHSYNQEERDAFVKELHRILVPGMTARIAVPYWKSTNSLLGVWPPFHEASFMHHEGFDQTAAFIFHDETWNLKSDEVKSFAIRHYMDVVSSLVIDLKKK